MPNILEFHTVQTAAFRILIEALKEILTDANLELDKSGKGLCISCLNSRHGCYFLIVPFCSYSFLK